MMEKISVDIHYMQSGFANLKILGAKTAVVGTMYAIFLNVLYVNWFLTSTYSG